MIFHGILSIRSQINRVGKTSAFAFILVISAFSTACYRVPEPTSSTRAHEVTPDDELPVGNPSGFGAEPEPQAEINRDDPNLSHDFIGTESGVTTEPSETEQIVDEKFRPESDEEEDETGDAREKNRLPSVSQKRPQDVDPARLENGSFSTDKAPGVVDSCERENPIEN